MQSFNPGALSTRALSENARDLSEIFENGKLRITPAAYYRGTSEDDHSLTCVLHGLYCLPTVELVEWLKAFIGDRSALEIGAGNGVLAEALGIRATDNRMQEWPNIAALYRHLNQAVVRYGDHVENIDAAEAVKKYQPQVVVASWVTHKFDPRRPNQHGNEYGVVEEDIIAACEAYVFVGNRRVHAEKSIWSLPHEIIEPDWLFSRAGNDGLNFIGIWRGGQ